MKIIWCGLKITENCHILIKQLHGNFRSKTLGCRKIKTVFRDVKWCFNASWGLKGLMLTQCRRRWHNDKPSLIRCLPVTCLTDQRCCDRLTTYWPLCVVSHSPQLPGSVSTISPDPITAASTDVSHGTPPKSTRAWSRFTSPSLDPGSWPAHVLRAIHIVPWSHSH